MHLISRAQTELRSYWKRNLEGKIGKSNGRHQMRNDRNQNAYAFSGERQRENQGKNYLMVRTLTRI
jgi:hypothetical protein